MRTIARERIERAEGCRTRRGAFDLSSLPMDDTGTLEGRTLAGRYRVVRLIGTGGMGSVYEGVQLGLDRRVALKVLKPEHVENENSVARFRQEALAAARIAHPHIVQVSDFIATEGEQPFLVMEYVEGKNLRELVEEQGPLPLDRVVRITSQVLEALATAHAAGVIHRDIKPDNIVITSSATLGDLAKVLDFGIAKMTHAPASGSPQTEWGAVLGTLTYMPPEQARSEKVDARSDVYAVGGCMYFATTGKRPVDPERPGGLVMAILTEVPESLAKQRPEVDRMFEDIVMRALRKSPLDRFTDADAMRGALATWRDASAAMRAQGLQLKVTTAAMPSTKPVPDLSQRSPDMTIDDRASGPPGVSIGLRAGGTPTLSPFESSVDAPWNDLEPLSHTAPIGRRPSFPAGRDSAAPHSPATMMSPAPPLAMRSVGSQPPPVMMTPRDLHQAPMAPVSSPRLSAPVSAPQISERPVSTARPRSNEARNLSVVIGVVVLVIFLAAAVIVAAGVFIGMRNERKTTTAPPTATTTSFDDPNTKGIGIGIAPTVTLTATATDSTPPAATTVPPLNPPKKKR